MKKLYIYNEKQRSYYYDEAWVDDGEIIEHIGKIGTKGRVASRSMDPALSDEENLLNVLSPAIRGGYQEIPIEMHRILIIEYVIDGFGKPADLDKRHALEERMNDLLGWTGLGHCDGGSIGSGTMEVCCFVIDFDLARSVIEKDLKKSEYADYSRIYDEGA